MNNDRETLQAEFLEYLANYYHFFKEDRRIFLERFSRHNSDSSNVDIANVLGKDRQEFQDYLSRICETLGVKAKGRGRQPKGESPWEKAYTWIWNDKFSEYCQTLESTKDNFKTPQNINIPFQDMINEQLQQLTSNSLMKNDGIGFNLEDIYIPLGLVEQKKRPKLSDISPEKGLQFSETEYEVTREFTKDEFFTEVLDDNKNNNIAIIGEAGAGKSTLLQIIAKYILDNNPDHLVMWVSLADLKDYNDLEDYLLEEWLRIALQERKGNVSEVAKDKLEETFKTQTVWLLLDGVDEMGMNNPLSWVNSQLKGWIGNAKVILTCRLNVWDNGKNALDKFDVYRNLDFTDTQVTQFINSWFAKSNLMDLATSLQDELNKAGKERIKDLIKNPLRLTLLCYAWQQKQGNLPETKAELYKLFVDNFYKWKDKEFPITDTRKKELNKALGELARQALDQDSSRFRLTHDQIVEVLGEADDKESCFKKALDIGWLNRVGVAEEDATKSVYAFFHPSFQEYFAALSIDDWDFFLPKDHIDKPVKDENGNYKKYRVFQKEWEEVILLWFGRKDIDNEVKENFIEMLINFEDNLEFLCSFYKFSAYFVAIKGLSEFGECKLADQIIENFLACFLDKSCINLIYISEDLYENFWKQLRYTNRQKILNQISHKLDILTKNYDIKNEYEFIQVLQVIKVSELSSIFIVNKLIAVLEKFLTIDQNLCLTIAETLSKIDQKKLYIVDFLNNLFINTTDQYLQDRIIRVLSEIGVNNIVAFNYFIDLLKIHKHPKPSIFYWQNFRDDYFKNSCVIKSLIEIYQKQNHFDDEILSKILEILGDIGHDDVEAINFFCKLIAQKRLKPSILRQAILCLGNIGFNNSLAINTLKEKLTEIETDEIKWTIAFSLCRIELYQENIYAQKILLETIENCQNVNILFAIVIRIRFIPNPIKDFITTLISIIERVENENLKLRSCWQLYLLEHQNPIVINTLNYLLESSQDERILWEASSILLKVKPSCFVAFNILVNGLDKQNSLVGNLSYASSLEKIFCKDLSQLIIKRLKTLKNITYYRVLFRWSQNMTYPEFYEAWHNNNNSIHPEATEITPIGNTSDTQILNQQLTDIPEICQHLNPQPISIDIKSLTQQTNPDKLAKKLANRIYKTLDIDKPTINDVYDLEDFIITVTKQLNLTKLPLILYGDTPNQTLLTLCQNLSEDVHFAIITDAKIEFGFPPDKNLKNTLQSWLDRL